jgi:hypothetical protein
MCSNLCLGQGLLCNLSDEEGIEYILALKEFAKDVGAPEVLICDSAKTQKKREVKDFCTQMGTTLSILEAETQWANRAELFVGLVKEATRKDLRESGLPIVL